MPDTSGLMIKTVLNTNITEVEYKITNTISLVTKTVSNTKISEVENKISDNAKYSTTQECNTLIAENFVSRLKQSHSVNKTDFDNKRTNFNKRITSNNLKKNI